MGVVWTASASSGLQLTCNQGNVACSIVMHLQVTGFLHVTDSTHTTLF